MTPMKIDLPYLYDEPDHRGNPRLYVRKGARRIRIRNRPGSDGFAAEYAAALGEVGGSEKARYRVASRGTFGWLAGQYFSSSIFLRLDHRPTAGYAGGRGMKMGPHIQTLLYWLTGGRPMLYQGYAFRDVVSGKAVHYWVDHYGRHWMAEHKWSRFRVERSC